MKPKPSYPKHRAKFTLAACLAAMVATASPLSAQQTDDTALATDEDVETLSAFTVSDDKDYGYLKTNSATATRIGMEIQKVPMNVSVLSRDFLDDTNAQSITDIFRYSAAASGDSRFAMRRPANEATPQGLFTMRGFSVNTLMRNGVFRYVSYNLDNVERVEVVKGPAAVFFGQGYPGGVINYVTKRPQFTEVPTTFKYSIDDNAGTKLVVDHNAVLSKKAAFRVVGAWEDSYGDRKWEFKKNFNITPSLTLKPFDSGKVTVHLEMEYLEDRYMKNDLDWIYGAHFESWKAAHGTDGSSRYDNYGAYVNDLRAAQNDYTIPYYTSIERGAYYTDANGNWIQDESFNWTARGSQVNNVVETFSAQVDFAPFDWLEGKYVFTRDNARFDAIEGTNRPHADGIYWNSNPANLAGYYRETFVHNLDLVFKFDLFGVKNKILTGYQVSDWTQQYNAQDPNFTRWYGHVPGINNAIANPGGAGSILGGSGGQVPSGAVVRDRNGNIKTPAQVFNRFDPGFDIHPDVSVALPIDRSVLDGYKTTLSAAYLNWQASLLDERLDVIAGIRREVRQNHGQHAIPTYPWVITPYNAHQDTVTYPASEWGYHFGYQKDSLAPDDEGDSWMAGASYAVTKSINVYASVSKTFKFNQGTKGGNTPEGAREVYESALAHGGGSYQYLGTTITSAAQAESVHAALGAFDRVANENGMNWELGAKITNEDSSLVGTISVFRGERTNQRLDDSIRQSNAEEPYNYSSSLFTAGSIGYNTRNFRWRTTDLKNRIEGAEAEFIWTPMKNYQAVINGSWLWTAKTVYDKTRAAPGTPEFNALNANTQANNYIYYNARIENVPEYRLNMFHKYTFTDGPVRGASVGVGMRYSSETVIDRSNAWNPLNGGLMAGDFVVFDLNISYPWEVLGYKIKSSLGIYNVTDKDYMEGRSALAPPRNYLFSNTISF